MSLCKLFKHNNVLRTYSETEREGKEIEAE